MALLGLDIGTTGCKCTIFNLEGTVLSYAYQEYALERPQPGYYELNPSIVLEAVKHVIYQGVHSCSEPVSAISISSFGEAAVPIGQKGNILGNSILYMDQRGREQCRAVENRLGREKIMELSGIPSHPMYTLSKLMWIRDKKPDIFKETWKFMLFGDFITYCLTGKPVIDYSLASRTMAFNVVTKKWEDVILEAAGIDKELFSQVSPSATIVDTVKVEIAQELGLSTNTVVVTGGHDQVCAALGAGILETGLAIDGIGTVECITPVFHAPVCNKHMLEYNFNCAPHAKEGMYATYAFNFTGGALLKWYRDCFAQKELEQAAKAGLDIYAFLDQQAAVRKTDILVLPHFAGAGTPYMDPGATGAILGLTFNHTASDVYRGMLEGITFEMRYNLECLQAAGIETQTLRAVGGGARSDLWLQIKADIMQMKVERLNVDEAGTLGTAMMAGTATGLYSSLDQAAKRLIRMKKAFYPDTDSSRFYLDKYERYKKLYGSVNSIIRAT